MLFGEMVEMLEWKGKSWIKIRCTWDDCIGWVQARQIKPLTTSEHQLFNERYAYCLDLFQPLLSDEYAMPIPLGARLPDFDGMKFTFDSKSYHYSGQAVFPENLEATPDRVLKIARRYLLAPYQWGGRSPFGIDAAGLTQMVFKLVGIRLHRTPEQQVHQGELVDFNEQSMAGDLAFFENSAGTISHTGIILPENKIIHAAEQVRIDRFDHFGIFDEELNKYTHHLRVIKRVLKVRAADLPSKKELKTADTQVALF